MSLNPYQLSELISKHIQQILSEEETLLLESWLDESEDNRKLFDRLVKAKQVKSSFEYFTNTDLDSQWEKASKHKSLRRNYAAKYVGYAAAVVIFLFSLFIFLPREKEADVVANAITELPQLDLNPGSERATLQLSKGEIVNLNKNNLSIYEENGYNIISNNGELNYSNIQGHSLLGYNTLSVPKAGRYRLILADGTKVWLNSLSELTFPVQFSAQNRKVQLKGEAYFEVAKETSRPFIVEVASNTIEVLGTHFNVKSYDSEWKTTLVEGSVKVRNDYGSKVLIPGQQANIESNKITVEKVDIRNALAWRNNEFYFKNQSMKQVLLELSRWYDFVIDEKNLDDQKQFSGSIDKNLKLSEALRILGSLSGKHFYYDGQEVRIKSDK